MSTMNRPICTAGSTALAALLLLTPASVLAQSVPTNVTVRVISHDAKIIGSGVGGARVSIRDASTGELLATGLQEGGTGDTNLIIREPRARGVPVFATEGAGHFTAALLLEEPTVVEVFAQAPMGAPEYQRYTATRTMLLLPGRHVTGEGVILELNGFTVQIQSPTRLEQTWDGQITARVTMLCGCPTEPGGLWDADAFDVWAEIVGGEGVVASVPLEFAGETSIFTGRIPMQDLSPGMELRVYAAQEERANLGMAVLAVPED
jgi:hypothetical protein